MATKEIFGLAIIAVALLSSNLRAGFITDTTISTATRDGVISAGEYVGGFAGVNGGFGNVIGSGSTLYVDSSSTGTLNFGFQRGGGGFGDVIVIYIDSKSGGFGTTANFTDNGDPGRRAASGVGTAGQRSTINFASGFNADYAISIEPGFAGIFELRENTSHNYVDSANVFNSGSVTELQTTLAQLGLSQGGTFKYLATYLNQDNAYRSNEFNGVSFSGGNPGNSVINLGASDFHSFQSVPEPTSLSLLGLTALAGLAGYRRRVG